MITIEKQIREDRNDVFDILVDGVIIGATTLNIATKDIEHKLATIVGYNETISTANQSIVDTNKAIEVLNIVKTLIQNEQ